MDKQFHTLAKSYIDNYVEYSKTKTQSYKTAYESAEQGIQSIIKGLEPDPVNLQEEKDELTAAEMRQQSTTIFSVSHTTQYIVLGALSAVVIGLLII